jgi:hypothetical protein
VGDGGQARMVDGRGRSELKKKRACVMAEEDGGGGAEAAPAHDSPQR